MVGRDHVGGDSVVMETSPPLYGYGTHPGVVVVYGDCDLCGSGRKAVSKTSKRLAIPWDLLFPESTPS